MAVWLLTLMSSSVMKPVCATHHGSTEISTGLAGRRSLADFLRKNFWSGTDACLGKSTWISLHLQGRSLRGVLHCSPSGSSNTARFKEPSDDFFILKILRERRTHFINIAAETWKQRDRLRCLKDSFFFLLWMICTGSSDRCIGSAQCREASGLKKAECQINNRSHLWHPV